MSKIAKLVIIGSGPSGLTAAIYAGRSNLSPVLFEGFQNIAGGQLMTTTLVENFPGFPEGILGPDLMGKMKEQALRCQTEILTEDVEEINLSSTPFSIKGNRTKIDAHALIIATGARANRLDIPGTKELWQRGVSTCAICDGATPLFRDKELFVVGGGDSAVEEALFLTRYAKRVFIVHRRKELAAAPIMVKRVEANPKIMILWNRQMIEIQGTSKVERVILKNLLTNEQETLSASGVFFAIGHTPNTAFLKGQLAVTEKGFLLVKGSKTSIEGVFAAGDVVDSVYRQAITAAGSGCIAAIDAEKWLSEKGHA